MRQRFDVPTRLWRDALYIIVFSLYASLRIQNKPEVAYSHKTEETKVLLNIVIQRRD